MKQQANRRLALTAAALLFGLPILSLRLAHGADTTAAPAGPTPTILADAPANLAGWVIPSPAGTTDPTQSAQLARGRYLTVAGDCLPCHSVAGQPAFSGGLAVGSPFGALYSPNITPSKTYGIGNYTDRQFWNVLHQGIAPGSSLLVFPKYLYPSMPFDAYSKLSYPDVMAIKAYLDSLPAAEVPSRAGQIPFPFNVRAALLGWRLFFFSPQPILYDASWSPSVRNGAFLVQALEHCSDCHTPRNFAFAAENSRFLAGGNIPAQSWYAPNITASPDGAGSWPAATLTDYLGSGGSLGAGAPFGPMQEVVNDSLSRLPASDVADIAAYLQAVAPQASTGPAAATVQDTAAGATVYADNCARCHGADGEGVANNFPNLAGNQAVTGGPSNDVIAMLLGGFNPWHQNQSAMPAFAATLSPGQIAAVTNYIRTAWGNHGVPDATAGKVGSLRSLTAGIVTLDTGTTEASLTTGAATRQFDVISGTLSRDGDKLNCQLDATLGNADPTTGSIHLAGICATRGTTLDATLTANGQTTPVTLTLRDDASGLTLSGPAGNGQTLHAHITTITPNG